VRQRGWALGRMYFVPPNAGERFFLRLLLTIVLGPKSFNDLRTVNGILYPSFHDASLARGLLEDDSEWSSCLREAAEMQTGGQLRRLFITILLFCEPSDPERLWRDFRHKLCEDLHHALVRFNITTPTEDQIFDYGLYLLSKLWDSIGKLFHSF
jgi:hypothetical protein